MKFIFANNVPRHFLAVNIKKSPKNSFHIHILVKNVLKNSFRIGTISL